MDWTKVWVVAGLIAGMNIIFMLITGWIKRKDGY